MLFSNIALVYEKTHPLMTYILFSLHTKPEKFGKNGGFPLKTHQMFSVHTTLEKFINETITGQFGFMFAENSVREIT